MRVVKDAASDDVAGHVVPLANTPQGLVGSGALREGHGAARMKWASGRRVSGTGNVSRQARALRPGEWVGLGHGGQQ